MRKNDDTKKDSRVMGMVVVLVWLVVFMIVVLGIVFPLVFFISLKEVHLKDQSVAVNLSARYIRNYIEERQRLLSVSAQMAFLQDSPLQEMVVPALKGIPESAGTDARRYFQTLLDQYSSFRFFAYLTPETVQPVFLQPYMMQTELTDAQFAQGYSYREWAQGTIAAYNAWDRTGFVPSCISKPFISQPGNIPAISVSVGVVDERKALAGILYVNMTLNSLSEFVKSLSYGKTGKVFIVDSAGNLLAHPEIPVCIEVDGASEQPDLVLKNLVHNPMVANALKNDFRAGLFTLPENGQVVLASMQTIPSLGWIVVLQQDALESFSIITVYAWLLVILVLFAVFVSFTSFLFIARETAESSRKHQELLVISETDPLTGLLNRRSMLSRMNRLISEFENEGHRFVIAMFDIDNFKKVNDTYGHVFGDVVLREIAARSVSILRVEDLLFRWGGEEFLLVIRNSDLSRGRGIAEKIRRVVADTPVSDGVTSVTVTVTIGVSQYKGGPVDAMIIHADEALYEGKRSGKNTVVISRE